MTAAVFDHPALLLLPRRSPQPAPLLQVLTLLKQLLPEVAADNRVAALVDAIGEVLAGHADHATFLVPKISVALIAQKKYS